jgi:hypothetical protein
VFRAAPATSASVTRRALVATVSGAALVLAGCDLDPRSGSAEPDAPDVPEDPDVVALIEAAASTAGAAALVAATVAAHPGLGPRLAAFATLHATHGDALDGAAELPDAPASPRATPPVVPGARPLALAAVRTAESALATDLAARALRAESGTFARLLAVMSAAVQQELLALDRGAGA